MNWLKLITEVCVGLAFINLIIEGFAWSSVLILITAVCFFWGAHIGEKDA